MTLTSLERQGVALARAIIGRIQTDERRGGDWLSADDVEALDRAARELLDEARRVALPHEVQP